MDKKELIKKIQCLMEDVASLECHSPKEAEWQKDLLDLLHINAELLRRYI